MKIGCAIIGSGNIGTDLMYKLKQRSETLAPLIVVGIDEASDGLAKARAEGIETTHEGIVGMYKSSVMPDVKLVFDATSAKAHISHAKLLQESGHPVVDLTPAAVGPYVVPVANLNDGAALANVNMVTCGGQATIPIVHALSSVGTVHYAEIVASISSRSAGPGTRANIDEFTITTAKGLEDVGGARRGKAIIVLNPAEPPVMMRDTVYCLVESTDETSMTKAIDDMVGRVAEYVPGYQMVQRPVFEPMTQRFPTGEKVDGTKVTVFLRVEGAGDYLPKYAGNLDIMTAAAARMGEEMMRAQHA